MTMYISNISKQNCYSRKFGFHMGTVPEVYIDIFLYAHARTMSFESNVDLEFSIQY